MTALDEIIREIDEFLCARKKDLKSWMTGPEVSFAPDLREASLREFTQRSEEIQYLREHLPRVVREAYRQLGTPSGNGFERGDAGHNTHILKLVLVMGDSLDRLERRVASLAESHEGLVKRVTAVEGVPRVLRSGPYQVPCQSPPNPDEGDPATVTVSSDPK